MIDFRIYRAGFLPALVALVVLLFALQAPPASLPPVVAPAEFDQVGAASIARQIVAEAPARPPGSRGDARVAEMVEKRFKRVNEAEVAEQRFDSSYGGEDVQLRNLILTLPGESPHSVVLMASRDSAGGPGAASSAAATAALLELVDELRTSRHAKTLVFVSTDGASDGAVGAGQFADHFSERDLIDGLIVLWQPGSAAPRQPALLDSSAGAQSASSGLVRTADRALTDQTGTKPETDGLFGELARLALPTGLGEQAVLIERGINAVGLSSAGERQLRVAEDEPGDLSASTLGDFGRTALLLAATLDGASAAPEHGPDVYLTLAGNLVPGWTLALLALTLMVPATLAAADGLARAIRGEARVAGALGWSLSRALPFVASLLLLYLITAIGVVPRPTFPFDPNRFGVGFGEVIAMGSLGIVILAGCYAIRGWRVPVGLRRGAVAPALGLISVGAVLLAWLANPYLALLLVPAAHVWLLDARREGTLAWPLVLAGAGLSLVPLAAACVTLTDRMDLGAPATWQVLLMVGDGQIGFATMLALCLLAGCTIGTVALAVRDSGASARPEPRLTGVRRSVSEPPTARSPARSGRISTAVESFSRSIDQTP